MGVCIENLNTMFDYVNEKAGEIASTAGQTPGSFNSSIMDLVRNLSNNVIMDAVRSSNSSGNSDVTSEVAIRRACITTNNVEAIYEYGKNEQIDNIINFERALNLYSLILETYDDNISKVLRMRLEGKSYEQMEIELSYAITTLRQYVYMSKELLKEKYEYTISIFNARNSARRNIE